MSNGGRRAELDGVRGIAILLVLVGHTSEFWGPLATAGVTLFFVLSGYLITGILLGERERHGRLNLRRFYGRRFTRLAPPLFIMLAVMAPLLHASWDQWLAAATWVANYTGGMSPDPFSHTWSLAVEEQFYLVWPVALLGLTRLRHRAAPVLSAAIVVLLAWRIFLAAGDHYIYAYSALETAGVPILAGCLVALTGFRLAAGWAGVGLVGTFAVAFGASVVSDGALWSITPVLVLPAAALAVAAAEGARWLAWRPLAFCGVASYSIYLWHAPVSWLVDDRLSLPGVLVGAVISLVAHRLVEVPVMRWREGRRVPSAVDTAKAPQPALA